MRVALCTSGHLRTFEHTFPKNRAPLSGASCDLFLHLWDNYGFASHWSRPLEEGSPIDAQAITKILAAPGGGLAMPTVLRIESPSSVKLDVPARWTPLPGHEVLRPERVFPQFYKVQACDRLRQRREARGGFAYDLVLRSRPDLVFSPIPWDECAALLPEGTVGVPQDEHLPSFEEQPFYGVMSDKALLARPATMARMAAAIEFYPAYLAAGTPLHAETLWRKHAENMGFRIVELPFSASIVRRRTYFDVGANNGSWGIEAAKKEPASRVFAFEPTPELVAKIRTRSAGLANYVLVEKAVSNKPGKAEFHISGGGDWGCSSLLDFKPEVDIRQEWPGRIDIGHTKTIEVECITMQDFVDSEGIESIEFFHCDVQGMDLEVLQSFGDRISRVQAGVIEAATSQKAAIYANQTSTVDVCREWLTANNFRVQRIESNDVQNNEVNIFFKRVR